MHFSPDQRSFVLNSIDVGFFFIFKLVTRHIDQSTQLMESDARVSNESESLATC